MSKVHISHEYDPSCEEFVLANGTRIGQCLAPIMDGVPAWYCGGCKEWESALEFCPRGASKFSRVTPADPVNSPEHYRWLPVEAIEITEHFNFCMGNALKYIIRADHKGKPIEDLKKSLYYIEREIANREKSLD